MTAGDLAGKRVAVYARYSSDNQREASIEDQIRRCRVHIERNGGTFDEALVFADHAISGASLARPSMELMLRQALAKPRTVDVIVTEDMSRLSRDLADAAMLFKQLAYAEVPIVGIADGINTGATGAKVAYTVKALLSDLYLDDLRDRTLRGLEGQALKGRSTGGLPFGYLSRPVVNEFGKVDGHEIGIDAEQASLICRIFRDYAAGHSQLAIARRLNEEGLLVPRAKSRHRRAGWVASTVREILHNESYVGRWTFKKRQWVKDPVTGKRRSRKRNAADVLRFDRPQLRIVEAELWDAVRVRLGAVRRKYTGAPTGDAAPGRRTDYPFSGLLRCGVCGAPMVIYGGSSARYYRCGDLHKRGICTNRLPVRESVVRHRMLEALRERIASPWAVAYVRKRFAEVLGETSRTVSAELRARRERLARTEARIAALIEMMIGGDRSERVRQMRDDLEVQADVETRAIKGLEATAAVPIRLPTPAEVEARILDLERLVSASPTQAREALRRLFGGGAIRLEPQPDGAYIARSEILPLVMFGPASAKPHPDIPVGPAYTSLGCAGRI